MVELADTPVLEAGTARCASSSLAWGTKFRDKKMPDQKKSKNPFINAANAAKAAAANPSVPGSKTNQVQQVKYQNQVQGNKPATRSAGRGR